MSEVVENTSNKRRKTMAEEYKCPISHNLPVEPVIASDVSLFCALFDWFDRNFYLRLHFDLLVFG